MLVERAGWLREWGRVMRVKAGGRTPPAASRGGFAPEMAVKVHPAGRSQRAARGIGAAGDHGPAAPSHKASAGKSPLRARHSILPACGPARLSKAPAFKRPRLDPVPCKRLAVCQAGSGGSILAVLRVRPGQRRRPARRLL